jgi:hypothetical protein
MVEISWFVAFGSASIENTAAAPTLDRLAPFHTADFELTDAPQPAAMGNAGVDNVEVTSRRTRKGMPTDRPVASNEPKSIDESVLTNSSEIAPPKTPPVQVAAAIYPTFGTRVHAWSPLIYGMATSSKWRLYFLSFVSNSQQWRYAGGDRNFVPDFVWRLRLRCFWGKRWARWTTGVFSSLA